MPPRKAETELRPRESGKRHLEVTICDLKVGLLCAQGQAELLFEVPNSNLKATSGGSPIARHLQLAARPIEARIVTVRGHRVLLDSDLAALYGVTTGRLNEQVARNLVRFPQDFMFRLNSTEFANLISQNAISSSSHGGRRTLPRAFTEQGVAMLSSVLNSPRAIAVNIEIMRAFVRLRRLQGEHAELARRIDELEAKYDRRFKMVFDAIRELMRPPVATPKRALGFRPVPPTSPRLRRRPSGYHAPL